MDFQVCYPQKTRVLCHLKMLPVTELMNIPDATFVKSTQSSATTEHDTTNHILEDRWTECRLWVPHRATLSIFTTGGDCLDFRPELQVFNDIHWPNWDTIIVHNSPMRVNDIHTPVLFRFESTTGLGHTYEYSTPLPIPLNPNPSSQCFNRRPLMRFMGVNIP